MPESKKRSRWSSLRFRPRRHLPLENPSYQQTGAEHTPAENGERAPPPPPKRRLLRRRYSDSDAFIARFTPSVPQGTFTFRASFPRSQHQQPQQQQQQQQQSGASGMAHRSLHVCLDGQSCDYHNHQYMDLKRWTLQDKQPDTNSQRSTKPFAFTFRSGTTASKGRARSASLEHTQTDSCCVATNVGAPPTIEDFSSTQMRGRDVRVHGRRSLPGFRPARIDEVIAEVDEIMSTDEAETREEFYDAYEHQC